MSNQERVRKLMSDVLTYEERIQRLKDKLPEDEIEKLKPEIEKLEDATKTLDRLSNESHVEEEQLKSVMETHESIISRLEKLADEEDEDSCTIM